MKRLTATILLFAVFLLPMALALPVGEKFTFRVHEATIVKGNREVALTRKSIPKGVPFYRMNKTVTFRIGKKSQLIGPGKLSIPLQNENQAQDNFNGKLGKDGAAVFKIPYDGTPIKVTLSFIRKKGSKKTSVYYTLF